MQPSTYNLKSLSVIVLCSTLMACGGGGGSGGGGNDSSEAISITAIDQTISLNEDEPLTVTLSASVSENLIKNFQIVDNPTHGVISGSAPSFTYTPDANFNGTDSFTFTATGNDNSTSQIATVTLTINPINDAPAAAEQTITLDEDSNKNITLAGTDTEAPITIFNVTSPSNGSLSGTAPNLAYTPNANFNGADSFTFTVTDSDNTTSAPATVTITVNAVNDKPTAVSQSLSTIESTPLKIIRVRVKLNCLTNPLSFTSTYQAC